MRVEISLRSEKIGAKIPRCAVAKIPFMLVLGDRELDERKVAVRERSQGDLGTMTLDEFKKMAHELKNFTRFD
ncbi:MAG: His/Gly/Thr/Pro-type tRNA ligase C-terminal domain-containing protein [Pyrinomonadaceae bacterium]